MRIAAFIAVLIVGLAIATAFAWNASETRALAAEEHYQSCVQAAQALPDRRTYDEQLNTKYGGGDSHAEEIYGRVRACSRDH